MTYVMSDIHGEYEKFLRMLEAIDFRDEDQLYIIGDVVDRGPQPIKLLTDISERANVFPIIGNHELMALDLLDRLQTEITEENHDTHIDAETLRALLDWQQNGGDITLEQFRRLTADERFALLEYLREFVPYEVIDLQDKTFILIHSGLGNFQKNKKLRDYTLEELCFIRPDYNIQYLEDSSVYIVCGHTPTTAICGEAKIYHNHNNIVVDCGANCGGKLACLRIDDMKEFYI